MPQPAYVIDELISAKAIAARVETLAREITQHYSGTDKLIVVGLLRGSFVFIADLVRGAQAFLDIARIDPVLVARGPDPGIAIGLQFQLHGKPVGHGRIAALGFIHLIRSADEVLHMVAIFVRHHIGPREIAARLHLALHLGVEIGVDVDALVRRAIERPHRALRRAAAGAAHLRIEHQLGRLERHLRGGEHRRPGLVE